MSGHDHSHGEACKCMSGPPPPLQQSLKEVAFEKGIWGYILRGASGDQVGQFVSKRHIETGQSKATLADELDSSGYTPLLYASRAGALDVCHTLLSLGADVNAVTPGLKQSSLHRAAMQDHAAIVTLLLNAGADSTLVDTTGRTALVYAHEKESLSVVAILPK